MPRSHPVLDTLLARRQAVPLLEALVLGIVQGLTEFLPISSSGHLVLVPAALSWDFPSLAFDTTVHLATLVAVVAVFWRDLLGLAVSWWRGLRDRRPLETTESRIAWWLILGTAPGVLVGLAFEGAFESLFARPRVVGGLLLLTALLLSLAERLGGRRRDFAEITWRDGLLIGIGQAAAIAPGLSRSGLTIGVGTLLGLTRQAAARFSFLLAVPIIAGAGLGQLARLVGGGGMAAEVLPLLVGFVAAAISGYLAIRLFLAYVRKRSLYPFAAYCVVAGTAAIVLL